MLRVKNGPCAPLRLSSMLSSPATGTTRMSVTAGEPLAAAVSIGVVRGAPWKSGRYLSVPGRRRKARI